jgi:hypothetical protein
LATQGGKVVGQAVAARLADDVAKESKTHEF